MFKPGLKLSVKLHKRHQVMSFSGKNTICNIVFRVNIIPADALLAKASRASAGMMMTEDWIMLWIPRHKG